MSNYKTKRVTDRANSTIKLGGVDTKTGKANPTSVEGYFLGSKEILDKQSGKPSKIHSFQTAKGQVDVWGKTNLDRLLTEDHLNQMVLVKYLGRGKPSPGKQAPYLYELNYDDTNVLDSSTNTYNTTEDSEDYDAGDTEELYADDSTDEVEPEKPKAPSNPVKITSDRAARVQAALAKR